MAFIKPSAGTKRNKIGQPLLDSEAPANALSVPSVYANSIEILSMNHVDVRIAFDEICIETGNIGRVERRANIVMSVPAFMMAMSVLNINAKQLAEVQQAMQDRANDLVKQGVSASLSGKK